MERRWSRQLYIPPLTALFYIFLILPLPMLHELINKVEFKNYFAFSPNKNSSPYQKCCPACWFENSTHIACSGPLLGWITRWGQDFARCEPQQFLIVPSWLHWLQWRNPTNRGSLVDWQLHKLFPLQKQQATGFTDYLSYLNVMSFKKGSLSCILYCFHSLSHMVLWILHFLTQGLHILYPYLGTTSHRRRIFFRGAKELPLDLSHFLHSFQTLSSGTVAYSMS